VPSCCRDKIIDCLENANCGVFFAFLKGVFQNRVGDCAASNFGESFESCWFGITRVQISDGLGDDIYRDAETCITFECMLYTSFLYGLDFLYGLNFLYVLDFSLRFERFLCVLNIPFRVYIFRYSLDFSLRFGFSLRLEIVLYILNIPFTVWHFSLRLDKFFTSWKFLFTVWHFLYGLKLFFTSWKFSLRFEHSLYSLYFSLQLGFFLRLENFLCGLKIFFTVWYFV